jgi:ABC-2 type transport system ATP-binding protein
MIKVKGLTVLHPAGQEIIDVNLTVAKGQVLSVVGPNSSGKALLGRVIADPAIERKGEIIINHFNQQTPDDRATIQIGYAGSEFEFEKYLTGYEHLDFLGSIFDLEVGERAKNIIKEAQDFEFTGRLYHLIESMSRADKKLLSLIGSIIHQPSTVIWDEPTSHLDPSQVQMVKSKLAELKNDKVAVLIITNDLDFAQSVSDEIAIMVGGEVRMQGSIKQLQNLSRSNSSSLGEIYRLATGQNE